MDPMLLTAIVGGGIFAVSYALGKSYGQASQETIIEATIDHLINDGYVYSKTDADGELVLVKINDLHQEFDVD